MKVIKNRWIPFKDFFAINLFGIVFIKRQQVSTKELETILVHESIHTKQMQELLYLLFYIWYIVEWFWLLLKYRNAQKAYRKISFEREAYAHQDNPHYTKERKHYAFLKYIHR